jgi:predicted amidohydrolase YtcJ
LLAIETALTRQNPWINAGDLLNADERFDLDAIVAAYTISGAYQMKLADVQRSIEVGKRADRLVLDRKLFDSSAPEIGNAQVDVTIFEGKTVHEQ